MRNPVVEYRMEASRMFDKMLLSVEEDTAYALAGLGGPGANAHTGAGADTNEDTDANPSAAADALDGPPAAQGPMAAHHTVPGQARPQQ